MIGWWLLARAWPTCEGVELEVLDGGGQELESVVADMKLLELLQVTDALRQASQSVWREMVHVKASTKALSCTHILWGVICAKKSVPT